MVGEGVDKIKHRISKRVNQVESLGRKTQKELNLQSSYLDSTSSRVNRMGSALNQIEIDLLSIEQYERTFWSRLLTCNYCCTGGRKKRRNGFHSTSTNQIIETFTVDERLTPQEIERLWCQTYDPNERWYQQMECHVDRLIELAELLDHDICQQKAQAISVKNKVTSVDAKLKDNRKTMKRIASTK